MLTKYALQAGFLERATTIEGTEMFFESEVAREFLDACDQNDLALAGISAFVFAEPELTPQPDLAAHDPAQEEKTWRGYRDLCNQSARYFLEHLPVREGLVVSLSIRSREDWHRPKKK